MTTTRERFIAELANLIAKSGTITGTPKLELGWPIHVEVETCHVGTKRMPARGMYVTWCGQRRDAWSHVFICN